MMNDLQENWNARWDEERTLPGLFSRNCRTMVDTFPTRVRLPLRYSLARLFVNPKYGGPVMKVRQCTVTILLNRLCPTNFRVSLQ